jgi:hypothetical protein
MSNVINDIMAPSAVPPWLPRDAQDARKFAYWSQIAFLGFAVLWFIVGIASIAIGLVSWWGNPFWGMVYIIMALLCGAAGFFMKKSTVEEIDRGRFHEAQNNSIIWALVGLAAFAIPTILLFLAYVKLSEAISPQTPGYVPVQGTAQSQQYQPPQYQPQQPQQSQQPAQQPMQQQPAQQMYYQPPQQAPADHKYQMMKCKNCGVQFPAFMTNCPNCGSPK